MKYMEFLSVWEISLLLLLELVSVNHSVLSDYVLRLIRRRDLSFSFCLEGGSMCEDVLLEIALLDDIFKVLSETGTKKFGVSYYRGMNSSLWLQDEQGIASWPSDDLPRVDPGWPRRRLGSKASARWSCWILGRLWVGSAEDAGMVTSWKRLAHEPRGQRRGLRAAALVLSRRRRG